MSMIMMMMIIIITRDTMNPLLADIPFREVARFVCCSGWRWESVFPCFFSLSLSLSHTSRLVRDGCTYTIAIKGRAPPRDTSIHPSTLDHSLHVHAATQRAMSLAQDKPLELMMMVVVLLQWWLCK